MSVQQAITVSTRSMPPPVARSGPLHPRTTRFSRRQQWRTGWCILPQKMGRCTHSICPDKPSWPDRETHDLARTRNAHEAEERCTTPVQLLLLRWHLLLLWRLFLRLVVLLLRLWILLTTFLVSARRLLLRLIALLVLRWVGWLLVLRWRLIRLHGCQEAGAH